MVSQDKSKVSIKLGNCDVTLIFLNGFAASEKLLKFYVL